MPGKRRSFVAVVKAAERALRAAGVDHAFVGALAVAAFGLPRTTSDVHVIVAYQAEDTAGLANALGRLGFRVSAQDLNDALAEGSHCTVHDRRSGFHLDVAPALKPAARDTIRGALRVRWRGVALPIANPEHTIVMKLVYGSEQDIEDALAILVRQRGRLNRARMREFARGQGVLAALAELERKAAE